MLEKRCAVCSSLLAFTAPVCSAVRHVRSRQADSVGKRLHFDRFDQPFTRAELPKGSDGGTEGQEGWAATRFDGGAKTGNQVGVFPVLQLCLR
jgi:hypothetical protein